MPRHHCRRVTRIHQAVTVRVLWIHSGGTGGAAFGIGLADNDWATLQLRIGRDDFETLREVAKLILDPHHHVAFNELGRAFGVKADEVERRAGLAGDVILALRYMVQEITEEIGRARASRPRRVRPTYASGGQSPPDGVHRVVI